MALPASNRPKIRRTVVTLVCTLGVTFAAMLIWRKLRIVTGVPRTAYAQPEQHPKPAPEPAHAPAAPH